MNQKTKDAAVVRLHNQYRVNLANRAVEAAREADGADPVVDAIVTVRKRLTDDGALFLGNRQAHREQIHVLAENALADLSLTQDERHEALTALDQDLFGWGRLDPFMQDPSITEILVDSWKEVDIERRGKLERVPVRWRNHDELMAFIKRLIAPANRAFDAGNPIVDVEIQGNRINATCPPVSISCTLNIRKSTFQTERFTPARFVTSGGCDWQTMRLILALTRGSATGLMCGPMGSAKTTMSRIAIEHGAPEETRWLVLEDVREIEADVQRFVSLQTVQRKEKPVTMPDLFVATKRKRPDRVAIGEVRSGDEAVPFMQSVQMGHPGGIGSTHAGTPKQALFNFVFYLKQTGMDIREDFLLEVLHETLDFLVFLKRFRDGSRRVTRVVEVVSMGDPEFPDGFRELIRWDYRTDAWHWVHPISDELAERLTIEGVRIPQPGDMVGPEDITPEAMDLTSAAVSSMARESHEEGAESTEAPEGARP